MTENEFSADALIDAHLPLLGLTLSAQSRAAVKQNVEVAALLSRLVLTFPLDDEAEPAPVFTP